MEENKNIFQKPKPQEPPDLEELMKNLLTKIKQLVPQKQSRDPQEKHLPPFRWRWAFLILFIAWIFAGLILVPSEKSAVVLRLGKYHDTLEAGVHWIPLFIDHPILANVNTANNLTYQTNATTKDGIPIALTANIEYRITNLHNFLFNMQNPETSIQLAVASVVNQFINNTTLEEILATKEDFTAKLNTQLTQPELAYKITKASIGLSAPDSSLTSELQTVFDVLKLNKSLTTDALHSKEKAITSANNETQKILQNAEAYKKQVVITAKAEIAEYLGWLNVYKTAPQITKTRLYYQTLENILKNKKTVLLDTQGGSSVNVIMSKTTEVPAIATLPPTTTETESAYPLRSDIPERAGYPAGDISNASR